MTMFFYRGDQICNNKSISVEEICMPGDSDS